MVEDQASAFASRQEISRMSDQRLISEKRSQFNLRIKPEERGLIDRAAKP
jgi:hypothetical protein